MPAGWYLIHWELVVFGGRSSKITGLVCLPGDGALHALRPEDDGGQLTLEGDPLGGAVSWTFRRSGRSRFMASKQPSSKHRLDDRG